MSRKKTGKVSSVYAGYDQERAVGRGAARLASEGTDPAEESTGSPEGIRKCGKGLE